MSSTAALSTEGYGAVEPIPRAERVRAALRKLGISHLARDCNHGRIFEVEPSEDANNIKRLQDQILVFASKRIAQIEGEHLGREVRLGQADNLRVSADIDAVVGQLLQHQTTKPVSRDTGLLLQPFDGAEARPILALKFQNPRRR